MGIKSDKWIKKQCRENKLLVPFHEESIRVNNQNERHVSHGMSSYGYDVTLDLTFKVFSNLLSVTEIDPLNFDERVFEEIRATTKGGVFERDLPKDFVDEEGNKYILLAPGGFALGVTKEYFNLPRDIVAKVWNKSTYARTGLMVYPTVAEPGWHGNLVLEFSNNTPLPCRLYANQGIAQITFEGGDGDCDTSYADRNDGKGGKYQGQTGVKEAIC